jgi:hypothetical protein
MFLFMYTVIMAAKIGCSYTYVRITSVIGKHRGDKAEWTAVHI